MSRSVGDIATLSRRKRSERRRSTAGTVNLAPMMDIMFTLLIFFLVATSFKLPEGLLAARVPRTTGLSGRSSVPLVPIKVYLEPSHSPSTTAIRISSAVQADAAAMAIAEDFGQLASHLQGLQAAAGITDQTPVIIVSRDETQWDHVVGAYNAAVRAKFQKIVFASWK